MSETLENIRQDPFFVWWAWNQIWVCCGTEKVRNRLSFVVACWLPTVCGVPSCSIWVGCGTEKATRNRLSLVGFWQCVGYPLAQLVRFPYAVQVMPDCFIRNLELFGKLTTGLAAFRASLSRTCGWPMRGFISKEQISWLELLEPISGGNSLTTLSPIPIFGNNVIAEKPTLKS